MLLQRAPQFVEARHSARALRRAFTLMEILIVVAIIVILAGLGVFYLMPQLTSSQEKAAKVKAIALGEAAQAYKVNHGQYPNSLAVLAQPDPGLNNMPYVGEEAILDPWNNQYQIDPAGPRNKGAKPDVFTTSPSGKTIGNFR